jgi:hypothetical protein
MSYFDRYAGPWATQQPVPLEGFQIDARADGPVDWPETLA